MEKIKKIGLLLVSLLLLPNLASASDVFGIDSVKNLFCSGGSSLSCSRNIIDLITGAVHLLLLFAGSIAVVFVIIGGYFYITSGGNEEQAEKGKKTLVNAIIGVVIILMSNAIINVVVNTITGQ